jgi:dienelactone hydrolase
MLHATREVPMPTEAISLPTTAIRIPVSGRVWLDADIATPPGAKGIVLFAHGSGSSRQSPRNRFVASELISAHIVTVLVDLLTPLEERLDAQTRALRFDIQLLTSRLIRLVDWLGTYDLICTLPIGLFGASTGAAAALDAAAARPEAVRAVVSRGGRPDLAANLHAVTTPTLLIVGGNDPVVVDLNQKALALLSGEKRLEIVPGATHLFDEPGTLERAASLATEWFGRYLPR